MSLEPSFVSLPSMAVLVGRAKASKGEQGQRNCEAFASVFAASPLSSAPDKTAMLRSYVL